MFGNIHISTSDSNRKNPNKKETVERDSPANIVLLVAVSFASATLLPDMKAEWINTDRTRLSALASSKRKETGNAHPIWLNQIVIDFPCSMARVGKIAVASPSITKWSPCLKHFVLNFALSYKNK